MKKKKYFVLFKDQECCKWSVKVSLVKEIGNWFPDLFIPVDQLPSSHTED